MTKRAALICFSLMFYWPTILLVTIFLIFPFLLSFFDNPATIADLAWLDIEVAALILVTFLPFLVSWGAFKLCRKCHSDFAKATVIYVGWLLCATGISFIFFALIGGASMAVVDGDIQGWDYLRQALEAALHRVPSSHLFIIPWVAISYLIVRTIAPELISERS